MKKNSLKIRVKFVRHQGQDMPLSSMLEASKNLLDFLSEVAKDAGVPLDAQKWIASKFQSSSPQFVLRYDGLDEGQVTQYRSKAEHTVSTALKNKKDAKGICLQARRKLLHITDPLGTNDKVELDFLENGDGEKPQKSYAVSKIDAAREFKLLAEIDKKEILPQGILEYYGGIRGKACEWHKEGYVTYVLIKDLETNEDIKCYYANKMYSQIHEVFEKKDSIVLVSGKIRMNQDEKKIERMEMKKVAIDNSNKYYQDGDFDKFFGCAPGLTGELSPREYIEKIRHGDE